MEELTLNFYTGAQIFYHKYHLKFNNRYLPEHFVQLSLSFVETIYNKIFWNHITLLSGFIANGKNNQTKTSSSNSQDSYEYVLLDVSLVALKMEWMTMSKTLLFLVRLHAVWLTAAVPGLGCLEIHMQCLDVHMG